MELPHASNEEMAHSRVRKNQTEILDDSVDGCISLPGSFNACLRSRVWVCLQ